MKTCRELRSRILPAVDGSLSIEAMFEFEEHLRACADCRERYEEARALDAALARLPEPPVERVDVARAVARVRAAIDRESAPAPRRATRWVPLAIAATAAAAILVAVFRPRSLPAPAAPSADRGEPTMATESPALPPATPEPVDIPLDPARLAQAREEVRCLLALAAERLPAPGDPALPAELASRFDEGSRDLERSRWPVLRLVEGALGDPDPAVARAALRYLGMRGDRLSIRMLEGALARPQSLVDAALALCDAGEAGLDSLAPAVRDPRASSLVLARVSARGGPGAARFLEACVRETARVEGSRRGSARLLEEIDALARTGTSAVASLLRLGSDGTLTPAEVIDALARTQGAGESVADFFLSRPRGVDDGLVLQALAALQPSRALPLLEKRCLELRERRGQVLECIEAYGGKDGLATLLRLSASGRIAPADLEIPILSTLSRDRGAGSAVVEDWSRAGRRVELHVFQGFLFDHPVSASAPACIALSGSDLVPSSDRRWAVLLAGETGIAEDADALAELFWRLKPAEKELRAACLIAIRALAGVDRIERVVDSLPSRTAGRVLALLAERDARTRPASTASRLARELESALAPIVP